MLKVKLYGVPMVCSRDGVLVIWHDSSYLPRTELFQRPFFKLNSPLTKILLVRTNAIWMHPRWYIVGQTWVLHLNLSGTSVGQTV